VYCRECFSQRLINIKLMLVAIKVTDEGARPRDFFKKDVKDESISKKNFTAFC